MCISVSLSGSIKLITTLISSNSEKNEDYSEYVETLKDGLDGLIAVPEQSVSELKKEINSKEHRRHSYIARGLYLEQIQEWMKSQESTLVDGGVVNGIKFFKDITVVA